MSQANLVLVFLAVTVGACGASPNDPPEISGSTAGAFPGDDAERADGGAGLFDMSESGAPGQDEGCAVDAKRSCYPGDPKTAGKGACTNGAQTCLKNGEFSHWGPCEGAVTPQPEKCDKIDNDCNGAVDDAPGCAAPPPPPSPPPPPPPPAVIEVPLDIKGDCVTASCPAIAPYPVGCAINFVGDTPVGCVASTPNFSTVFFKEGVKCDAGHLVGKLLCSSVAGSGLNAANCPINKTQKNYPATSSACP